MRGVKRNTIPNAKQRSADWKEEIIILNAKAFASYIGAEKKILF